MLTVRKDGYLKLSFFLFSLFLFLIININIIHASDSQNVTLTDQQLYNFSAGTYNVVKIAENEKSGYEILFETKIPYINYTYTAKSNGYLYINIHPIMGSYPRVALGEDWTIKPTSYSKKMITDETVSILLSPNFVIKSYNTSKIQDGYITIWELYNWPNLEGLINSTFFSSVDISLDIVYYPTSPSEGNSINLFADADQNMHNISWNVTGGDINWYNESEVLEIKNIKSGNYTVSLKGFDEFNTSHKTSQIIYVKPSMVEPAGFDISLYSLNYPDYVNLGEKVIITTTVDFFTKDVIIVKCLFSDSLGEKYNEKILNLLGSGTKTFSFDFEANQIENKAFVLQLFYYDGEKWVELKDTHKEFTIAINEVNDIEKLPSFNIIFIIIGLVVLFFIQKKRKKLLSFISSIKL